MAEKQKRRLQPGAKGAGNKADARSDPEKQRENQRSLGVGPEHKTPAMKKGHRGTFP
jgi:hypothetical protein